MGSDRGRRAGRVRAGPRSGRAAAGPGRYRAVSAWDVRRGRGVSASAGRRHARARVAAPAARGGLRLEVCGSGRRAGPGGPEDAARPGARRAGGMERPRRACPRSRSPPPRAVVPPRRQGGFVWFPLLPSPFSPLRALLPPSPFTGLLRDLAPPPLPPPRHRLL